ncbi:hypothetical protein [Micromonospora endolithica]|uniref:hypothetical protein n=1 Tax=Micromonospora endolithica TaxID=230091 RepID=UPI0011ADD33D|nr:hypothetical protein [Micromonospora endolithica]TWJ21587.1 hypothetical protein JD76_01697 [Micromonospora endolithica]
MGTEVIYRSVSVDGSVADENDQPGPLFGWLLSGDVAWDSGGELTVSQASYDYIRPYLVVVIRRDTSRAVSIHGSLVRPQGARAEWRLRRMRRTRCRSTC